MSRNGYRRMALLQIAGTLTGAVLAVVPSGVASAYSVGSGYDTATSTGTIGPAAPGDAITTSQMIARAHDWINNAVPYSQTEGWIDSGTGGPYRQDCSGFASMAWGLKNSLVTWTLPSVSTVTDPDVSGDANLNPGDVLDYTADHDVLFDSWINKSAGTFYYDAEHTYGEVADQSQGNIYSSTLEGYPISDFEALRYNNIRQPGLPALASAQVGSGGNFDLFYVVDGQVKYRTGTPTGGWLGVANVPNAPSGVTGLSSVQLGTTGNFDLVYDVGGTLKYQTGTSSGGWLGIADVPNAPAGVSDVASVQLGSTGNFDLVYDVGGTVKYQTGTASGGWLGIANVLNAPSGVTGLSTVQLGTTGNFDLVYDVGGTLKYQTGTSSGGWLGIANVPNAPAGVSDVASVQLGSTGNFDLVYDVGGTVKYQTGTASGGWLGIANVPNAPSGVSALASVQLGATGNFDVFYDINGTLKYQTGTSNGSWLGIANLPTA
jgi:hypothetical protein